MQTEGVVKGGSAAAGRISFVVQPRHVQSALDRSDANPDGRGEAQSTTIRLHGEHSARLLAETRAELEEVLADAQRMIEERRAAAEADIAELRCTAEAEIAAEREQLEARLRQELQQDYEARFGTGLRAIESLRSELETARGDCFAQSETEALALTLDLSRTLLLRELSLGAETLGGLIAAALARLRPLEPALLELAPAACAEIETLLVEEAGELRLRRWPLRLSSDPALAAGQFRLSSGARGIDVDVQQLIDETLSQLAADAGLSPVSDSNSVENNTSPAQMQAAAE